MFIKVSHSIIYIFSVIEKNFHIMLNIKNLKQFMKTKNNIFAYQFWKMTENNLPLITTKKQKN